MSFRCMLFGHSEVHNWEEWYAPAFGAVEVEIKECERCGRSVPTGRDRPAPKS